MLRKYKLVGVALMLVVVSAIGAGVSGASPTKSADNVVSSLPKTVQAAYTDFTGPVGASVYKGFKPKHGPPWTIGYASSYAGNTWRAGSLNELTNVLIPAYQKAGLVKKLIVTQSNLNDSVQIQQIRQLMSQGADIILLCCPSVALNPTVKAAAAKGIPVVAFSGYTTSSSVNVYGNYSSGGYDMATWVAKQIGGKGNLLYVNGIPGQSSNTSVDAGVAKGLAKYPNVKLVGTVAGSWTDQVAKTEVLKWFATHPEKVDGIITQSAQEVGVLQAVIQAGRPLVPMTIGGEIGAACYWLKHPAWKTRVFNMWPPAREADAAMSVMIRILQGQGPKIQSITRSLTQLSYADVKKLIPASCDVNSGEWIEPTPWFAESYLNQFFTTPKAPLGGK